MKKLSSMLALGMALALTFGMTVSAAESVTTTKPDYKPSAEDMATADQVIQDSKVSNVTVIGAPDNVKVAFDDEGVKAETVAEIMNTDVVQEAMDRIPDKEWADAVEQLVTNSNTGLALDKVERVEIKKTPVAAVDITCEGEIPEGGLTLEIESENIKPDGNLTYVIMHLNSTTGQWEIIIPDKVENGKVTATFTSFSPALVNPTIIVPLAETEPETPDTDSGKEEWLEPRHPEAAAANPATSPKTAETLPVAGVMALIGLAGAAICASKVRYNK